MFISPRELSGKSDMEIPGGVMPPGTRQPDAQLLLHCNLVSLR
jgi:hypothetical protein